MKTMIQTSCQMIDLEGVKRGGKRRALYLIHPSDVEIIIRIGLCATDAKTNGAINIWEDDDGNVRCEAMRNWGSIDKKTFKNARRAIPWVKKWMRKIK